MNERQARPSGSGIGRMMNCGGSWALTQALDLQNTDDEESTEWADRGNRIHDALKCVLKGGEPPKLAKDEQEDATALLSYGKEAYVDFFQKELEDGQEIEVWYPEERLWFVEKMEKMFSGAWDAGFICRATGRALILDYKSGWWHQRASEWNWQLISYGTILMRNLRGIDVLGTAILQRDEYSLVSFTKDFLDEARDKIVERIHDCDDKNPYTLGFNPDPATGRHCTYCPAKLNCPALNWTLAKVTPAELTPKIAAELVPELPDDKLNLLLNRLEELKLLTKAGNQEAEKRLVENPDVLEGWEFTGGRWMSKFPEPAAVKSLAIQNGLTEAQVDEMASYTQGALQAAFKESTGYIGKEFNQWWAATFAPLLEKTQSKAAVRKRKPAKK